MDYQVEVAVDGKPARPTPSSVGFPLVRTVRALTRALDAMMVGTIEEKEECNKLQRVKEKRQTWTEYEEEK